MKAAHVAIKGRNEAQAAATAALRVTAAEPRSHSWGAQVIPRKCRLMTRSSLASKDDDCDPYSDRRPYSLSATPGARRGFSLGAASARGFSPGALLLRAKLWASRWYDVSAALPYGGVTFIV